MKEKDKEDIELKPNHNADTIAEVSKNISSDILKMYDVYSYRHAATILKNSFPNERILSHKYLHIHLEMN